MSIVSFISIYWCYQWHNKMRLSFLLVIDVYEFFHAQYAYNVVLTSVRRRFNAMDLAWASKRLCAYWVTLFSNFCIWRYDSFIIVCFTIYKKRLLFSCLFFKNFIIYDIIMMFYQFLFAALKRSISCSMRLSSIGIYFKDKG